MSKQNIKFTYKGDGTHVISPETHDGPIVYHNIYDTYVHPEYQHIHYDNHPQGIVKNITNPITQTHSTYVNTAPANTVLVNHPGTTTSIVHSEQTILPPSNKYIVTEPVHNTVIVPNTVAVPNTVVVPNQTVTTSTLVKNKSAGNLPSVLKTDPITTTTTTTIIHKEPVINAEQVTLNGSKTIVAPVNTTTYKTTTVEPVQVVTGNTGTSYVNTAKAVVPPVAVKTVVPASKLVAPQNIPGTLKVAQKDDTFCGGCFSSKRSTSVKK